MDNVWFQIQEVDSLPIDERTGKFRLIVRNGHAASGEKTIHIRAPHFARAGAPQAVLASSLD
jgi:hypothetical protein